MSTVSTATMSPSLATPPNDEWITSADTSGTIRFWGVHNSFVLHNEFCILSCRIDDLQWSPDQLRIVVSGDGKGKSFVRDFVWDSGSTVGAFDGNSKRVLSCAFKPTRPSGLLAAERISL
ncbi:unnamed protein product [Linum trigynum]|uniref:Uncharacterized protein n=1 Tax=Linum trigynum TaxID=586398 RepID=A0AAV2GBU4_9ROSI